MMESVKVAVAAMTLGLAAASAPPAMAAEPAQDAVDLFVDFCVTDVLGLRPRVTEPSRLRSEEMAAGKIWEFGFKGSRVKLLAVRGEDQICGVQVSRADEAAIQAAFLRAIERTAAESGGRFEAAPAPSAGAAGANRRSWILETSKAKLRLSIAELQTFGYQYLMTSSPER